jgi:hypothetical protein
MWEGVYGGTAGGGASASTATQLVPPKPMEGLAARLHTLASELATCNDRVATLLNRLVGPQPANSTSGDKQPDPSGALMIAQFGAERISRQVNELSEQIARLESIV